MEFLKSSGPTIAIMTAGALAAAAVFGGKSMLPRLLGSAAVMAAAVYVSKQVVGKAA